MNREQRAALRAIMTRLNTSLAEIDACDEEMVGGSVEIGDASDQMKKAHDAIVRGHEYILRVAAHNKRVSTALQEANHAALALLDAEDSQ